MAVDITPTLADVSSAALVSIADAAAALRIHPETLKRWIRAGRAPAYGLRGAIRVSVAEVRAATRYQPERRREPNQRRDRQRPAASRKSTSASAALANSAPISEASTSGPQ